MPVVKRHPWVWLMEIEVVVFILLLLMVLLFALFYPLAAYSRNEPYRMQPNEGSSESDSRALIRHYDESHGALERSWADRDRRDAQDELNAAQRELDRSSIASPSYPGYSFDRYNSAQIRIERAQSALQDADDEDDDDSD